MKRSLTFFNEEYEDAKKMLTSRDKELKNMLLKNKALEAAIQEEQKERRRLEEEVNMAINPIEFDRRRCNLELHGLAESSDENLSEKVASILQKIAPGTNEVEKAFRYGRRFGQDGSTRNRPILIIFKNRLSRENIFSKKLNLHKLNDQYGKLFLNENLPQNLKALFGKANERRKIKGYKFIWTKEGTILVRKAENTPVIAIKKLSDIDKIV